MYKNVNYFLSYGSLQYSGSSASTLGSADDLYLTRYTPRVRYSYLTLLLTVPFCFRAVPLDYLGGK